MKIETVVLDELRFSLASLVAAAAVGLPDYAARPGLTLALTAVHSTPN